MDRTDARAVGRNAAAGHWLIEPYLFDVMSDGHFDPQGDHHAGPHEHDLGSLTYVLYGLTDRLTVGMIPRFAYNEPAGAPNSSAPGVGELHAAGRLRADPVSRRHSVPAIALVVRETLPTGRYERLTRPSDGFGGGAYQTAFNVFPGLLLDAERTHPARASRPHVHRLIRGQPPRSERLRHRVRLSRRCPPRRRLHRRPRRRIQPDAQLGAGTRRHLPAQRQHPHHQPPAARPGKRPVPARIRLLV